jgi:hypothetical protein
VIRPALLVCSALLLGAALAACEHFEGISHEASLGEPENVACAESVLRSTEGVSNVQIYNQAEPSRWGADRWMVFNAGGQANATLQFRPHYRLALHCMNCNLPQSEVDAFIPVMHSIEARFVSECAMDLSQVQRVCMSVDCAADQPGETS